MNLQKAIFKIYTIEQIALMLIKNPNAYEEMLNTGDEEIYQFIFENREKFMLFGFALINPACPEKILRKAFALNNIRYWASIARNPKCPEDLMKKMLEKTRDKSVVNAIYYNPNCSFKKEMKDEYWRIIEHRGGCYCE